MTSKVEFWRVANGFPGTTASEAEHAEADGWDGLSIPDSQNLTGDPYVALALAASVTSKLLLRPGVTNSFTRHPAVTAASILTVQVESKGRAVLGIGRGDSALAYLGLAPVPVNLFRTYVERVQGYLRGEEMPFDTDGQQRRGGVCGRLSDGVRPERRQNSLGAICSSAQGACGRCRDRSEADRCYCPCR